MAFHRKQLDDRLLMVSTGTDLIGNAYIVKKNGMGQSTTS